LDAVETESVAIPLLLALIAPIAGLDAEQSAHWYDGRAELAGYRLRQPRYGELRSGEAVLVYVTETFSESARVKADPGRHPPSDEFGVMKLNLIKDFQTGIYDYNVMASVFVALDPRYGRSAGTLSKLTFSSQEWCGQTFDELLVGEGGLRHRGFSYFDGEGDSDRRLDIPPDAIHFERLFIAVRQIPEPLVGRGEARDLPIYGRLERSRFEHRPATYQPGRVARREALASVSVPAGRFEVDVYEVQIGDATYRFDVEAAFPHRLVRWTGPDGEVAELTGSARRRYWRDHAEGDEKLRRELGLSVPD
jgi:hypothetical protein